MNSDLSSASEECFALFLLYLNVPKQRVAASIDWPLVREREGVFAEDTKAIDVLSINTRLCSIIIVSMRRLIAKDLFELEDILKITGRWLIVLHILCDAISSRKVYSFSKNEEKNYYQIAPLILT